MLCVSSQWPGGRLVGSKRTVAALSARSVGAQMASCFRWRSAAGLVCG